ncbi:tRNA pseudouridine(55) synthase TruB [Curvivirga aplysinae]|uniref:tRNA pseudouridine(55) synthase TruB n=1 Tax=Curvivirga aplysinae TaxID=2529852 RepID=UPI0012BD3D5B|nr:tRNA pseudouridine(55) synthase TruB [Curvivirga aplysinae]MTI09977.1 tRNA pseudouridine(55) synthase TruB [Curvivirga aplysinae]
MGRKKKGNPVHGWVIIDKAAGIGSTPIVGKARRALNAQKAGHGGTLDPFATGLLPLAFGEATKSVSYVMDGIKTYQFTLKFGEVTDTLDLEGEVVAKSGQRPTEKEMLAAIPQFVGNIEQVPPKFSALKIDGKRAYDLARAGEEVEMKSRPAYVKEIKLIKVIDADHAFFEVTCGKGFYVRSLGRDLAEAMGTVGHLTTLRRTKIGPFEEKDAILLEDFEKKAHNAAEFGELLLPIEAALDGIPALSLEEGEALRLRNGQAVTLLRKVDLERIADLKDGDTALALFKKRALALVTYSKGEIKPTRVFVYQDTV